MLIKKKSGARFLDLQPRASDLKMYVHSYPQYHLILYIVSLENSCPSFNLGKTHHFCCCQVFVCHEEVSLSKYRERKSSDGFLLELTNLPQLRSELIKSLILYLINLNLLRKSLWISLPKRTPYSSYACPSFLAISTVLQGMIVPSQRIPERKLR